MANITKEYKSWVTELKNRIQSSQIKAAMSVNSELLLLYWHLGLEILDKEKNKKWGTKLLDQLSTDLLREFPQMKGFRRDNLYRIRQWVLFYTRNSLIVAQLAPQLPKEAHSVANESLNYPAIRQLLCQIPWGHNREVVTRCSDVNEALFYVAETKKYNWSRNGFN